MDNQDRNTNGLFGWDAGTFGLECKAYSGLDELIKA